MASGRIPIYEAGQLGLRPSDRASEAYSTLARRGAQNLTEAAQSASGSAREIGSTTNTLGQLALQHEENAEMSRIAQTGSHLAEQAVGAWNTTVKNADSYDTTIGPAFIDKVVNPASEKFVDAFVTEKGRKTAEALTTRLREHMIEKTTADMGELARQDAIVSNVRSTNSLSNMVKGDPSSLDMALQMHEANISSVVDNNPNLKGAMAAKVKGELLQKGKETIVKSAFQGMLDANPNANVKEFASRPEYSPYISGSEVGQMEGYARQQQSLAKAEAREATRFQKEQAQKYSDQSMFGFLKRIGPGAEGAPPTRDELNKARALPEGSQGSLTQHDWEKLTSVVATAPQKEGKVFAADAKVKAMDMIKGIYRGEITSGEQVTKELGETLDQTSWQKVMDVLHDPNRKEIGETRAAFLKSYGPMVNPPVIGLGGLTEHIYGAREFTLHEAILRQETLAQANGNIRDAYDPKSEYFIGKQPEAQPPSPWQIKQDVELRKAQATNPPPEWLGSYRTKAQQDPKTKDWFVVIDGVKNKLSPPAGAKP